jgi:hypothetical protein
MNAKKVYVDIQSLLDLRMGALVTISPEFAFALSEDFSYYDRKVEKFGSESLGYLDKKNYDAVCNKYKTEILKNSILTKAHLFVLDLCCTFAEKEMGTPTAVPIEISVNTYPYAFTQKEINELILCLTQYLGNIFAITVNCTDLKNLSVSDIADNYLAMVMYNPKPWLDAHARVLQRGSAKHVKLYTPRVNHIREFTEEENKQLKRTGQDLFEITKLALAPAIGIEYIHMSVFCVDTDTNRKLELI